MKRWLFGIGLISCLASSVVFAEDPCEGMFNLVNRPNAADTPCPVPYKKVMTEVGYNYVKLKDGNHASLFPQMQVRFGLPSNNEIYIWMPSYFYTYGAPGKGFSSTQVGYKQQVFVNQHWNTSLEAAITPPSGSAAFGSDGIGYTFNGVTNYSFTDKLGLTLMLGANSLTQSKNDGGKRYFTMNPIAALSYQLNDRWLTYVEAYGQTRTDYGQGWGLNGDIGLLYLVASNFEIDAVVGKGLQGNLADVNHYIGAGFSLLLA